MKHAKTSHMQLTELAIDLDEGNFNSVAEFLSSEVSPYLANTHALEPTGILSAAGSLMPDSGRLALRE